MTAYRLRPVMADVEQGLRDSGEPNFTRSSWERKRVPAGRGVLKPRARGERQAVKTTPKRAG